MCDETYRIRLPGMQEGESMYPTEAIAWELHYIRRLLAARIILSEHHIRSDEVDAIEAGNEVSLALQLAEAMLE